PSRGLRALLTRPLATMQLGFWSTAKAGRSHSRVVVQGWQSGVDRPKSDFPPPTSCSVGPSPALGWLGRTAGPSLRRRSTWPSPAPLDGGGIIFAGSCSSFGRE